MAETITMPDLGFDASGGVLTYWLKGVGDSIQAGEPIAEIESDKVTLEVESPSAGVMLELLIQPGQNAPVGAPMARVGAAHELSDERPSGVLAAGMPASPTQDSSPAPKARLETGTKSGHSEMSPRADDADVARGAHPAARSDFTRPAPMDGALATPIARRMAQEHNLDLTQVTASGPGGRILREDVERHLAQSGPGATAVAGLPSGHQQGAVGVAPRGQPSSGFTEFGDFANSTVASPLRRAIAQRMSQSKQSIPHFYITSSVSMDDALALRKQINAALSADEHVTVNDLVMKATALALRDFPNLNASYVDDHIVYHPEINVGAAVAVEGGVLTVVNRQTDRRTISDIARSNRAMIQRARAGKVKPEDVTGGTFTISNLGGYNTDHFAAIISPPQAAILGVATAKETAVVVSGQVVARAVMQVTISADHRVTDGVECARFLQRVQGLLESPIKVLLE